MKVLLMKPALITILVVVVILASYESQAKRKHLLLKALLMAPLKGRKLLVLPVPVPMPSGGAMDHLHSRFHQSLGALQQSGSSVSNKGLYGLNQPQAYVQQHQWEGAVPGYYY